MERAGIAHLAQPANAVGPARNLAKIAAMADSRATGLGVMTREGDAVAPQKRLKPPLGGRVPRAQKVAGHRRNIVMAVRAPGLGRAGQQQRDRGGDRKKYGFPAMNAHDGLP